MALHKQIKGSGYKQYEDKNTLESILFDSSKQGQRKREQLIDHSSCDIESKRPKTGIERYILRQNKSAKIQLNLQ